jgi:TIR domain
MIQQDLEENFISEKGEHLDKKRFHENWVKGIILCAEADYGEFSKDELIDLAICVENTIDGNTFFYPSRVTWCSARILIGLGLCGRNIENSSVVARIVSWMLNHEDLKDGCWISSTGTWNKWIEVTALSIIGLMEVGISDDNQIIKYASKKLFESKDEWIKEGEEMNGLLALQAYTRAGGDVNEVIDQIQYLSKWIVNDIEWKNTTKDDTQILIKQSCSISQISSGFIDLMWRYVQRDLSTLLKYFDDKRINSSINKSTQSDIYSCDVFLCHNSVDKKAVEKIYDSLMLEGISAFFDKESILPGDSWIDQLEKHILTVKIAVIFIGKNGLGRWQTEEKNAILIQKVTRKCLIIPVILEDASQFQELPLFLQSIHTIDFREIDSNPLGELIRIIKSKQN